MVTQKVDRNWHLSEELFEALDLSPSDGNSSLGSAIEKAQVIECPDEFVKPNMAVKVQRDSAGQVDLFQPIFMKNPISGLSISEDLGQTWATMSPQGDSDIFQIPPELKTAMGDLLIRVESWIGGSDVLISSAPESIWSAGQDASEPGNNICRGISRYSPISFFRLQCDVFFQVIASTLERLGQNGANAAHLVEVGPTSEQEHLSRESEALARELMSPKKVFATQRSVLPSLANLSARIGVSGALAVSAVGLARFIGEEKLFLVLLSTAQRRTRLRRMFAKLLTLLTVLVVVVVVLLVLVLVLVAAALVLPLVLVLVLVVLAALVLLVLVEEEPVPTLVEGLVQTKMRIAANSKGPNGQAGPLVQRLAVMGQPSEPERLSMVSSTTARKRSWRNQSFAITGQSGVLARRLATLEQPRGSDRLLAAPTSPAVLTQACLKL